ncbi:RNA-guided endonuclease InsQ/TnpB family protein, partial [Methanobrevibacter sp.]|uniref:RNA-guided endonuclease InsQ/TnpB family protein n=1 Tax=Methanobrevibacter sp. TaxID=66852 RepID=UPI00388DA289
NLDLTKETDRIIHYQKIMSTHKKNSNRYRKAKRLLNKWWEKLKNKQKDYYDKKSHQIIENSSFIAVQNENIIFWKHNPYLSRKIQLNSPRKFMDKIQYKAQWNNTDFEKIPANIPTTQKCSKCGYKNTKLKGPKNLNKRNWKCPECGTYHDRDVNAAINILNEGLKRFSRRYAGAVKLS